MKSYKIKSHTADIRLEVTGNSIAELFTAALEGMASILKVNIRPDTFAKRFFIKQAIMIRSLDTTALLIDLLSEVLSLTYVKKALFTQMSFQKLSDRELEACIYGTRTESFDEDIKAVTYHEAEITKNSDGTFSTIIVFDI